MGEYDLHSLILACDYRVDDVEQMWKWLKKHRDGLAVDRRTSRRPLHIHLGTPAGIGDNRYSSGQINS